MFMRRNKFKKMFFFTEFEVIKFCIVHIVSDVWDVYTQTV